jgi:YVTN family beta-propeller protein
MRIHPRKARTAVGILILSSALGLAADVMLPRLLGRQADGSVLLATDQVITPAGTQIEFDGRANAMALSPDGSTAAVLNGNAQGIVLLDLKTAKVKQVFDAAGSSASYDGITYSRDGKKLYASQTGRIIVADVQTDGTLSLAHLIEAPRSNAYFPGVPPTSYPGGMALSEDGKTLYVALSRSNALGILNLDENRWDGQIPVGNAPHGVTVQGNTAYVSNQGGRPASHADTTVNSSGTEIVADPTSGYATTGTVSVVDLKARREEATVDVGRQPTSMLLDGSRLFVTNTNSDTVSVIDTQSRKVTRTISVKPFAGALSGSTPNGLALIGTDKLAVTLGRNNAVAMYTVATGTDQAVSFDGLVPVGYYPTAVATDAARARMYVLNGRGVGSLGADRTSGPDKATNKTAKSVYAIVASLSVVDMPTKANLPAMTAQVLKNNAWDNLPSTQRVAAGSAVPPVAIPQRLGEPSVFKHVFYVVKENRTYDQVLGDVKEGNGDPALVQFGQEVTPNLHALVKRFGLLDNHYDIGTNSADGHQWSTQAFVDDYVEKSYGGFTRSYPFNGGDALVYPSTGFLWDNAVRGGKSVRDYGEYVNGLRVYGETVGKTQVDGREMGPWLDGMGSGVTEAGTWSDFYNDALILRGTKTGPMHVGRLEAHSDVPSLDKLIDRNYPPYHQIIPDQYRFEMWKKEFDGYVKNGNLPDLNILALTNDHTAGLSPNYPTPRAMIADNDYALGRMVEAISKSPYWKDSVIFVIEDDTQNGVDHVSGQRGPVNVISAYSKSGTNSQYMTQIDFVAAMERILGLPPMNQMDMAVDPTHLNTLFTSQPDLSPFQATEPTVKLDEMNPKPAATSRVERAWAAASAGMDFNSGPDRADPALLNRAVWYATKGFHTPYPGDKKVLLPQEVHASLKATGQEKNTLQKDD